MQKNLYWEYGFQKLHISVCCYPRSSCFVVPGTSFSTLQVVQTSVLFSLVSWGKKKIANLDVLKYLKTISLKEGGGGGGGKAGEVEVEREGERREGEGEGRKWGRGGSESGRD